MVNLKLFISQNCKLCTTARKRLKGMDYTIYDVGTLEGLAEASYHGILSTPTLIETNEADEEVQKWGSEAFKNKRE